MINIKNEPKIKNIEVFREILDDEGNVIRVEKIPIKNFVEDK